VGSSKMFCVILSAGVFAMQSCSSDKRMAVVLSLGARSGKSVSRE
jgi:hypothetical protein